MFLQLYIDGAAGQSSSTTFIYIKVQTSALMTQLKVLSTRACAAIRTTLVYKQQSGDAVCGNAVVHIGPIGPCTSGTPTGMQTLNFIKSCISLRVVLSRPHTSLHYQHVKAIKDVKSKSTRLNTVALYSGLQCGWRVENVSAHCNPSSVCAEENTHAIVQTVSIGEKLACYKVMRDPTCRITFLEATPIFSTRILEQHAAFARS